ncbi:hypothetical protein BGZ46_000280 [Entomortierella lignicola]|nr:hypothetical protein BGZ46_000280 [Entomortierella lignicola]
MNPISLTNPLLPSIEIAPEDAPNRDIFDPKCIYGFITTGEPSEYAFQAQLSTIIKSLLSATYQEKGYKSLIEVKEYDDNGDQSQRLDILIRDGGPRACGYELVVASTLSCFREHVTRAQHYAGVHHTDNMLVVNLCPKPEVEYFEKTPDKSVVNLEGSEAATSKMSSRLANKNHPTYKESLRQPLKPFVFPAKVTVVNVNIRKDSGEADLVYRDREKKTVMIKGSEWHMCFN